MKLYIVLARESCTTDYYNRLATADKEKAIKEYDYCKNRCLSFDNAAIQVMEMDKSPFCTTMLKGYHEWNLDFVEEVE